MKQRFMSHNPVKFRGFKVITMVKKDEYDWPTSTVTNFGFRVLHGLQSGEKSMPELIDISGASYYPSQFESHA